MAGTIVSMDRSTVTVDGTNKYEIMVTCDVKGTLPDTAIFLLLIQNRTDPRDDRLLRIVDIADTTVANTDRDVMIATGQSRWRSNSILLQYDDIETANVAWKELSARINRLVTNVDTFLLEFETGVHNDTIIYPTTDQATKDALTAAYLATLSAVTTAEEARDADVIECNDLKKDIDNTTERLTDATADLDRYTQVQSQLTSYNSALSSVQPAISTAVSTMRTLNATSSATAFEQASIEAQAQVAATQLVSLTSSVASLVSLQTGLVSTSTTLLQSRVATLTSTRSSLLTEYSACLDRAARLQATVDAARATRDAALASVRVVCPDYVPPT